MLLHLNLMMRSLSKIFGSPERFRDRIRKVIIEVDRLKSLNIDPLEILDRYYMEHTYELLRCFNNDVEAARKHVLKVKGRI